MQCRVYHMSTIITNTEQVLKWDLSLNLPAFPLGPQMQGITVFLNSQQLLNLLFLSVSSI